MEIGRLRQSGPLSARSMVESIVVHTILLALLMLVGASFLARSGTRTKKDIDIVFYRPAAVPVTPTTSPPPPT
jgi:membrane protein involved in colicin uptake